MLEQSSLPAQAPQSAAAHPLKLDDILVSSWGYEQTNVDFYRVVRVSAKSVWFRRIGSKKEGRDGYSSMAGVAVADLEGPMSDKLIGPKRVSRDGYVRLESYASAHLWDGRPQYVSWYA